MAKGTRKATAAIGGNTKDLEKALRRANKKLKKFEKRKNIGKSVRGAFGGLKSIAGFGIVAGLAVASKSMLAFEKRLTRLGIQANKGAAPMAQLRKQIFDISKATGVDAGDLLTGVEKFVSLTGQFDKAAGSMAIFAKVSAASGASMDDIANTAATFSKNLGLGADEMEKAFSILLTQGKAGAIELKDNARILSGIAPVFSQFGNKGKKALAEMGAVLQIVRTGFNTAEEAATGLQSLMGSLIKNSGKLKKVGVDVFNIGPDGTKRMRVFGDIVEDLIKKTKGDPEILLKLLGRKESFRAVVQIMQAGRAEAERLIDVGLRSNAVQEDSARHINSNSGKIERSMATLKATLNEALVKHVDDITAAIQGMGSALSFAVKTTSDLFKMFNDQGGASDVEIGMLSLREGLGLVPKGSVRKRLSQAAAKKAGVKATDQVRLPDGKLVDQSVAEELGFGFGGAGANATVGEAVIESIPLSERAPRQSDPFGAVPASLLQQAARDADAGNKPNGVEVGDAVIEVKVSIVDGNLTASVENDPGVRRGG